MIKKKIKFKNNAEIDLEIYDGYKDVESLLSFLDKNGIIHQNIAIVKFLDMYYCVAFKSWSEKLIIGKDIFWYSDSYCNKKKVISEFKAPFKIDAITKYGYIFFEQYCNVKDAVYYDLRHIDENIDVYLVDNGCLKSTLEYYYSITFVVLLGFTFYSTFFDKESWGDRMERYFNLTKITRDVFKADNEPNAIVEGINLFKCEQILSDGRILEKTFYNPKEYYIHDHVQKKIDEIFLNNVL